MRLDNFLLNEGRSMELGEKEAHNFMTKHCQDAMKGSEIFRGNRTLRADYYLIDTSVADDRISPFAANNIYNLLLSNLPSWKHYPKRNRSVICTTDKNNASGRGDGTFYRVLPIDNSKIGICPSSDIFYAFEGVGVWTLNDLNRDLESFFEDNGITDNIKWIDKDFSKFTNACRKVDKLKKEESLTDLPEWMNSYEIGKDFFIDWLDEILSPNNNGFKLINAGDKFDDDRAEVWTDGKCLLVKIGSDIGNNVFDDGIINYKSY